MSDVVRNLAAVVIATSLIAFAVGYTLLPRHPPVDVVRDAGRRLNTPVAAIPPTGARLQQPNPQLADLPPANHRFHPDDPVVAIAPPSPPPNYLEFHFDTRIDGIVPSYSYASSPRGRTVEVVPSPNRNPLPNALPENADIGEGEEGGHV